MFTSTPRLNFTPTLAPSFESPSKALGLGSPSKFQSPALSIASFDLPQDDYSEFLADGIAEDSGMDILQDFAKIGATNSAAMRGNNSRSGIRRSFTSRF
jgi:TolB-like protein